MMTRYKEPVFAEKAPPKVHETMPVSTYEEVFGYQIPQTEEDWAETKRWKKIDANDVVHERGPEGFRDWLNSEAKVHCVWRQETFISTAVSLLNKYKALRDPVVHGLLRRGEVCNVIAPPKIGKSWLVMALVMNVIGGGKFLDEFQCERGRALLIDNELHVETLTDRLRNVFKAYNVPEAAGARMVDTMMLRGTPTDLIELEAYLKNIRPRAYNVIVLDAFYKFYPAECNENSNSDIAQRYSLLDKYAMMTDTAMVVIHHSSKGNQGDKAVTDVGSGAGTISRACDSHIVLRPHEEDGAAVVDAVTRSWGPVKPFCARFKYPKWEVAEKLDPEDVKGKTKKAGERKVGERRQQDKEVTPDDAEAKRANELDELERVRALMVRPMTIEEIVKIGQPFKLNPWHWDRVWRSVLPGWLKANKVREVHPKRGRQPATYQALTELTEQADFSQLSEPLTEHTDFPVEEDLSEPRE